MKGETGQYVRMETSLLGLEAKVGCAQLTLGTRNLLVEHEPVAGPERKNKFIEGADREGLRKRQAKKTPDAGGVRESLEGTIVRTAPHAGHSPLRVMLAQPVQ
jgi:hypothetical protein